MEKLEHENCVMMHDLNNKIKEQDGFYPMKYVCKYMEQEAIHLTLTYILLLLQNGATLKCLTFQQLVCIGVIGQAV